MAEANINEQIAGWQKAMNQAFSALHAGVEASRHAQLYGVGIILRDEDGVCTAAEPHTFFLHRAHEGCTLVDEDDPRPEAKEVDHGEVVIYRVTFEDQEPRFVPLGDYTMAVTHDAIVVQAIHEDGFVRVVKNRYGDPRADRT